MLNVCTNTDRTHAVKVGDDLVENPEALKASIVDAFFSVEIREIGDGSEHHTYFIIRLTVQLLKWQITRCQFTLLLLLPKS